MMSPLFALSLAAAAVGPSEAQMLAIADRFDRAQLQKEAAVLEKLVDPEIVFIEGSGERRDKRSFISGWTEPGVRFEPVKLYDRLFTNFGADAFAVSARTTVSGRIGRRHFVSRIRFTDIFRRTPFGWRVVYIQVTRLAKPSGDHPSERSPS